MSQDASSKSNANEVSLNTEKQDVSTQPDSKQTAAGPTDQKAARLISLKLLQTAIDNLDASAFSHPDHKATLLALKDLQCQHLQIEEAYKQEWCEMKLRYLEKFRPLYHRRWVALTGQSEGQADLQKNILESANENAGGEDTFSTGTKLLPKFWLKTMKNHQALRELIEDHDEPILEFLEDICFKWVDPMEQTSFQLDFTFARNPYFKNKMLSKIYYLEPSGENDEESVLTRTVGTDIQWYKGKNVTETTLVRKQRNKRTNATRVVSDVIKVNSFFNFFKTHEIPSEDQLESLTEDDVSGLEMIMETEFELGAVLRDKIIPRAIGWYLGTENDDFASENMEDFEDQDETDESLDDRE